MNIVKGVADLIRRTSVGQSAEFGSASLSERLSSPTPKIIFSDSGDEAILGTLWGRFKNALDKVEKRKSFYIFLKQFLIVYKNWDPVFSDPSAEDYIHNEMVVGCSSGHPAEVIVVLIEEVTQITGLITELNTGTVHSIADQKGTSTRLTVTSEGLPVLSALGIITRSILNCRVFGFYVGIQKLTALMKAAVIQLKTITGALSADDKLPSMMLEKIIILQQLLLSVLLIVCSFIFLHPDVCEKAHLYSNNLEFSVPRCGATLVNTPISWKNIISERTLDWHQKAVVSLMEAGGLNWLVELLRVMRRLSMKEQLINTSVQYWTLEALRSALADNTRGQNHFRSIGGLEVLLDGLGLQSNNVLRLKDSSSSDGERDDSTLLAIFRLHVLSLEVLREAVFSNLSNLQFLCEDGRVHKFANSFCSLAFIFQEHGELSGDKNIPISVANNSEEICDASHSNKLHSQFTAHSSIQQWSNYAIKLSRVLASFLVVPEEVESNHFQVLSGRNVSSVSTVYGELSIRWFTRALLMIFPCIRACSNYNELSDCLRIFVCTLQHYALFAFRKVLVPSPNLLDIFRAEGVWDLFFSENFFYSEPTNEESADSYKCDWIPPWYKEICSSFENFDSRIKGGENDILQIEIISFVEFAATLSGTSHNLPECSILLDALEQSACHPVIAGYVVKSLLQILQLSTEKTYSSLRTLDAIARVLKVACILIEECKRSENWLKSVKLSIELFVKYLSATDDAKILVLHSPSCIDCLFKLFWEKDLRNDVLGRILELMKINPNSEEDEKAQLHLCSKYLETFTNVKERETNFAELSINLLVGMRETISSDQLYYQALFRDGECFLHIVSLLNGTLDEEDGEKLVLNVLQTLTCLLTNNDISKASFRALVGKGYKTLQGLLLDFCKWHPSECLLNALLHMLVDEKFDIKASPIIKNEDVILLYLSLLRKSSDSLRQYGLNVFLQLLRDSISNRDSCVRAGMLGYLLDWFSHEENDSIILKIAQLIQVTGGHSISGKDIRTMFALLRSEKVGTRQQYYSLLLTSMLSMLNEKGPTAFFDLDGRNSGIMIKTPIQWPLNKGFSFSCWLRIENFPRSGTMGLFSFLSEGRRGCLAGLAKDKLIYESINQKRQCVSMQVNLVRKKWHFVCLSHSIGRAFSGGSLLKCYVDGVLTSSEKCRYAKVNEVLTSCMIGSKIDLPPFEEENPISCIKESSPFLGQIGPIYMFNDAITAEQVRGIYSLGPSYMYAFLNNETAVCVDIPLPGGVLDPRDGLSSKIVFGLNAQASSGRTLYNVSPSMDHVLNKDSFAATVMVGTQLCSRSLLQQIIYCVGGVSVFFPLFTQTELYANEESEKYGQDLLTPITKERLTAEVIELIASVLDENLANQQQMLLLSGFSILGFLLQSVPQQQLNLETLSSLKYLFNVVANSGLSELLVKDAISHIFLNPLIWGYTVYKVQRELYMFLIQQFDNDPRLLKSLCRLPRVLDIIIRFYWDNAKCRYAVGGKHILHPNTKQILAERPDQDEIRKIRLLLLSLGEMSLRHNISLSDIKALISFFETSEDMACIEDVLHMVIRAVSQKQLLASFLEQVNSLGGCHIFVNLLQRDFESIRLLSLQFLGRLLVGLPSEKKGAKFFNISVGRSKSLSEGHRKISSRMQPIFSAISDRLFRFPQTESLCASLFDVLLGGASPKQVLQKHSQQLDMQRSKGNNSHFFLPQILVLIFKFLSQCDEVARRTKIIGDLLELLDSNPSNIEALMEYGWNAWLMACTKLVVLKIYKVREQYENELSEISFVRNLFCVVLCYYMHSVKGGWLQLEETVNFLLLQREQAGIAYQYLLRDIFKDIVQKFIDLSSEENIFVSQPCRDNTLFLLKLLDENLMSEINFKLPFPTSSSDVSVDFLERESNRDLGAVLREALEKESDERISRDPLKESASTINDTANDEWWNLYDNLWIIICQINGKGPSKMLPKSSSSTGPSFGQRARELVESLNIPAAEMAAVVVSGGLTSALGGKANKSVDKAMLLRGEKCHRIVFRLVILYLCRASLERASRCVQLVIPLLPYILTPEDDQTKSRLQLFIGALLSVRSQFGTLDDGARFHVISHMIRETVNSGKSMLVTSIMIRDESSDSGSSKGVSTLQNIIQKDRVLSAVADEVNYITLSNMDRRKQLNDLRVRIGENSFIDSNQNKAFEDEVRSSLNMILDWDDSRRASFKLSHDEEQQIVAEKWLHMFRTLMDERGPWSANSFPNNIATHWKLDKTEDSWRRRPKLRRNYHFDEKLCHPPSYLSTNEAVVPAKEKKSVFGGHIPEQMRQLLLKGIRKITDEGSLELSEIDDESIDGENISERKGSNSDQNDHFQNNRDTSTTSTEQENSEVLMSVPCVLVTPKRKLAGRFAVMMNVLHFFSEFLVEGTCGSTVFNEFQVESREKRLDMDFEKDNASNKSEPVRANVLQKQPKYIKCHRRWKIFKIKAVHWTRYLLRYTAIEIFFNDSTAPIFLNFASLKVAKDVGTLIVATRNEYMFPKGSRDKAEIISFVDRRVATEMAETARESWRRREMTNFQYLMYLNTLAGRSYNDLTQYPVFPWVITDYSSETLDFNSSSTFRDLSKPVGALDPKRLEVFEDRYRNFSDPDIPNFYYGSHYSSMGIVLFYLLRLEPFTALHRSLQGDKFDHADRLFQSIEGTYRNCLSNTSDVKELTPEFFYMPEFLVNSNSYHLGIKQDGEPLTDVCLPPWARGSPEEFINRNREALESEYVSSNLHHWIDLIFGYKQRGKPAVEAANIFYYLTYEGAVDLDIMEDDLQKSALEDQIANFGQTPIQIFRKKHPRRGPPIPIAHPLYFAPGSISLTSIVNDTNNPLSAIIYVNVFESNVVLVNLCLALSVKTWITTQLQSGGNFTFSGSQDPIFGIGYDILTSRKIGSPWAESTEPGPQCFAITQTPSENFLISCGNWENSFQVISLADGRLVQSVRQHKDVVSCVAVTSDGTTLATGSHDTTVMVWEVLRVKNHEKRVRNLPTDIHRKDCIISEAPFHILCGHDDVITCLFVSVELDMVISGSKDGTCIFHSLREGRYIRSIRHPAGFALSKLIASHHGRVVIYSDEDLSLNLYSINGKHITACESNGRLSCVELSSCGEFLVCAGDQGQIIVRTMSSLEMVKRYGGVGKIITSLTVTNEECFLAGTRDGSLLVYSIENTQLRKTSLPRNIRYKGSPVG